MKKLFVFLVIVVLLASLPLLASPKNEGPSNGYTEAKATTNMSLIWALIIGGAAIALAAMAGAYGQSKAIVAAAEGISRNPAVAKNLQTLLILGLAFIESLVIYVLLIDLIIFFVKWGDIIK